MSSGLSPKKKKLKLTESENELKRANETESSKKRAKCEDSNRQDSIAKQKRKNFVTACEQVSCTAYFDLTTRLQHVYLPTCVNQNVCKLKDKSGNNAKEMASFTEEAVKIETKTNMWCEALEVCVACVRPDQYLSANVLKEIVEIMLNAHEDVYTGYTIPYLLEKCQQILSLNFSAHPPCLTKALTKCYNNFLTSPLDLKEKTFTNRSEFGSDKGIVKYCMNRLEHELSLDSKDGAIVDKYEHIPEDMKQSVKGLHWQKEKFEIYELLERPDRIERLMAVLESIIELLQFDLAVWLTRYTNDLGGHIMRTHKPLMAFILWSNNLLYTGTVNNNCKQIFRLFVYMIHLQYPEKHIRIIATWLNVIIQTFYICETNSHSDYPNTGKYCATFAKEFYKIISEMPHNTIIKILERIQPTFMQHLVGVVHMKTLLSTQEDDAIKIFINFLKKSQWKDFTESNYEIQLVKSHVIKPKQVKNIMKVLQRKFKAHENKSTIEDSTEYTYTKFDPHSFTLDSDVDQNYVVHVLYITIEAYLDAFSIQYLQETLDNLNERLHDGMDIDMNDCESKYSSYSVSESFIKKCRSIYQVLKELILTLHEMKSKGELPEILKVFNNIGLLES